MILFMTTANILKLEKDYSKEFSETTGIEIQIHHWVDNSLLSMEIIAVEYFQTHII